MTAHALEVLHTLQMQDPQASKDVERIDAVHTSHSAHQAADIGELFMQHAPFLLRTCERLLVGSVRTSQLHAQAQDLVQDVFLVAHRKRHIVVAHPAPRAWLYQTMVHRVQHQRRGFARLLRALESKRVQPALEVETPSDHAQRRAHAQHVRDVLARVPLQQREVLVLCEFEGLDHRTAAQLLDVAVGTVASRLHAARSAFRSLWQTELATKGASK